jgi:hypothetical protein
MDGEYWAAERPWRPALPLPPPLYVLTARAHCIVAGKLGALLMHGSSRLYQLAHRL